MEAVTIQEGRYSGSLVGRVRQQFIELCQLRLRIDDGCVEVFQRRGR